MSFFMLLLGLFPAPARADVVVSASGSGWCYRWCNNTNPDVIAPTSTDSLISDWMGFRLPAGVNFTGAMVSLWNNASQNIYDPSANFTLQTFQQLSPDGAYLGFDHSVGGSVNFGVVNDPYVHADNRLLMDGHWVDVPLNALAVSQLLAAEGGMLFFAGHNGAACQCSQFGGEITFAPRLTLLTDSPVPVPGPLLGGGILGLLLLLPLGWRALRC